ncbi:serine-threonine protein kinase, putative [Entamoeba invadens IP1]|uniref:serine-threonine protein kinase, putative n=1 Tax=Entamoeba invadens IP1 TaxID=370355 RepID=UPI0002C3D63F|nr:serine-threonine protein kinase, putative [Entamoeba invadens IP1]ELP93074.1 serine-threonine protein kinase, putative [Entamoeba invadens IP1]|eukprot:XP_004259845.1 serine-threonine protein kinase, putative [Entamoeba invadens IP1]
MMSLLFRFFFFQIIFVHFVTAFCGDGVRDAFEEECDSGKFCLSNCLCADGYTPLNKDTSTNCVPSCAISGCIEQNNETCYTPDECGLCDITKGYRSDCQGCLDGYLAQGYLKCESFNKTTVKSCKTLQADVNYHNEVTFAENTEQQILTLSGSNAQMSMNTCSKRLFLQQPYAPGFWIKLSTSVDKYIAVEAEEHYDAVSIDFLDTQENAVGDDTVFVISDCPDTTEIGSTSVQKCYGQNDNVSPYIKYSRIAMLFQKNVDYYIFVHKPFGSLFLADEVTKILFTPIVHPCSYFYNTVNWPEIATNGFTAVVNTAYSVRSGSACILTQQLGSWYYLEGADRNVLISTCNSETDYYTAIHLVKRLHQTSISETDDCGYPSGENLLGVTCERYDTSGCPEPGSHHSSMMVKLSKDYDYFIYAAVVSENNAAFNLSITTLCPYDCGGNGVCDRVTQTCICDAGYVLLTDTCSQCGNGVYNDGEECEKTDDPYVDLNCDYTTCSCREGYYPMDILGKTYCAPPTCNNNKIDSNEECDGGLGCQHCMCTEGYVPYEKPRLGCLSTLCGNKELDDDEECDGGDGCYECECQEDWFTWKELSCQRKPKYVIDVSIAVCGVGLWIILYIFLMIGFFARYNYLTDLILYEQQKDERFMLDSTIIKFNKENAQYIDIKQPNKLFQFDNTEILFEDCKNHVEVETETQATVKIYNNSNEIMRVIMHGGEYSKYIVSFDPAMQSIRPGQSAEVKCKLTVSCTCVLKEKIPVTVRFGKFKQIMQELVEENPNLLELQSHSSQNSEMSHDSKSKSSSLANSRNTRNKSFVKETDKSKSKSKSQDKKKVQPKTPNKFYVYLDLKVESALSTRLDLDEINLIRPPIGAGTFGTVFRAEWRGVDVAVKQMKTDLVNISDLLPNFMQEASMMERIRCQYVVNYIGSVTTTEILCLVTEYCPLGSLRKFMRNSPTDMTTHLKIRFCQDIARGMEYLHQNDIVHRDLKTDNVLVVSKNPYDPVTAKVTDFGTSRSFIESSQKLGIQHIGTPMYMAPEMTLHKDEVTEQMTLKSDVYSFSICMLEIWKGKDCYPQDKFPDGESILKFVGNGKRLDIPDDCLFKETITKCWMQTPRDRPPFDEVSIMLNKIYKLFMMTNKEGSNENSKRKSLLPQSEQTTQSVDTKNLKEDTSLSDKSEKSKSSKTSKSSKKSNKSIEESKEKSKEVKEMKEVAEKPNEEPQEGRKSIESKGSIDLKKSASSEDTNVSSSASSLRIGGEGSDF